MSDATIGRALGATAPREPGLRQLLGAIASGSVASLIAWFDFYLFPTFSIYIDRTFFPRNGARMLDGAAVFALAFLARPVGGWFLGLYADRHGRGGALMLAIALMAASCLLIALCPGYATIGIAAPGLLLLAELMQGASIGGAYGSSATYLTEAAPSAWRGFCSSFTFVTIILGQLLATLLLLAMEWLLPRAALQGWGWRVAFLIGTALAASGLRLRRSMTETKPAIAADAPHPLHDLWAHRRECAVAVGLTVGGTLAFYSFTVYFEEQLITLVRMPSRQATLVTCAALAIFALLQPVFGLVSDRVGRRPVLLWFGVLGVVFTVPIMVRLRHAHDPWAAFLLTTAALAIVSGYTAISTVVRAELFPARLRALGVGLTYALTVGLFGGSAEYVGILFSRVGRGPWFAWYVTGGILVSLLVFLFMRETRDSAHFR